MFRWVCLLVWVCWWISGCSSNALTGADQLFAQGSYGPAAKAYEPLATAAGAGAELRRKYALALAYSGDAERAEPLLTTLMQAAPDAEVAAAYIDCIALTMSPDEAWTQAEGLLKKYPGSASVQRALGTLAAQRGDFAASKTYLEQAVKLEPGLAAAHANLGDLRLREGDLVGAMEFYQRALKQESHSPMSVRIRVRMAQILAETRPSEAIPVLQEALSIEPNAPDVLAELGKIMTVLKLYDQGIDYLKEAYEQHLERPDVISTLGYCFLQRASGATDAGAQRQDLLAAQMWLKRLLEKVPTYKGAHNNLGKVLVRLGDGEAAEAAFREELTLYPNSVEALTNLGRYLAEQGRLDEAREQLARAYDVDRRQVVLAAELGRMALLAGDWSAGVTWYQQAYTLCEKEAPPGHPCRSDVPYQLARIAGHRRDKDAAVQYFLKAVEQGFGDLGRFRVEGDLQLIQSDPRVASVLEALGTR